MPSPTEIAASLTVKIREGGKCHVTQHIHVADVRRPQREIPNPHINTTGFQMNLYRPAPTPMQPDWWEGETYYHCDRCGGLFVPEEDVK